MLAAKFFNSSFVTILNSKMQIPSTLFRAGLNKSKIILPKAPPPSNSLLSGEGGLAVLKPTKIFLIFAK